MNACDARNRADCRAFFGVEPPRPEPARRAAVPVGPPPHHLAQLLRHDVEDQRGGRQEPSHGRDQLMHLFTLEIDEQALRSHHHRGRRDQLVEPLDRALIRRGCVAVVLQEAACAVTPVPLADRPRPTACGRCPPARTGSPGPRRARPPFRTDAGPESGVSRHRTWPPGPLATRRREKRRQSRSRADRRSRPHADPGAAAYGSAQPLPVGRDSRAAFPVFRTDRRRSVPSRNGRSRCGRSLALTAARHWLRPALPITASRA